MILHSIVPNSMVLEQNDYLKTEILGVGSSYLEGVRGDHGFQIRRLISTDPALYLNNDLLPGVSYRNQPPSQL